MKDKIFDDIAKLAGGTVGALSGVREQIESEVRTRVDEMALRFDLVPREDFDDLAARLDALQKRVDDLESTKAKKK